MVRRTQNPLDLDEILQPFLDKAEVVRARLFDEVVLPRLAPLPENCFGGCVGNWNEGAVDEIFTLFKEARELRANAIVNMMRLDVIVNPPKVLNLLNEYQRLLDRARDGVLKTRDSARRVRRPAR